jgi:hypothetical protein
MGSELVAKIKAAARSRQMQGARHGEVISTGDGAARRYERPAPAAPYEFSSRLRGGDNLTAVRSQ